MAVSGRAKGGYYQDGTRAKERLTEESHSSLFSPGENSKEGFFSLGAFSVYHDTLTVTTDDTLTQHKVTIQEACKIANISRKTLYRWIEKGLLSKEKDGNRSYVSLAEVRALCVRGDSQQVTVSVSGDSQATQQEPGGDTNRVTVDVSYLEGLLVKLGQMEAEKRYLLEYKTGLEVRDKELTETKATLQVKERELAEIRAENDRLRLPFWKRLFKR